MTSNTETPDHPESPKITRNPSLVLLPPPWEHVEPPRQPVLPPGTGWSENFLLRQIRVNHQYNVENASRMTQNRHTEGGGHAVQVRAPSSPADHPFASSASKRNKIPELSRPEKGLPTPRSKRRSSNESCDTVRSRDTPKPIDHTILTSTAEDDEVIQNHLKRSTATFKRKRSPFEASPTARLVENNKRPGRKYENVWRIGQAPTAGLKESKEQTNFDTVVSAVSRYYEGNADGRWKSGIHRNASEYDGKGLTESIGASIIMAAGLIAAGQSYNATQILNRTLPYAEVMMLSQHPQVCFWLLEVSMDTTTTVAGNVRRAIKAQFAPLAQRLLGKDHPLSILLRTPLTMAQQVQMRKTGQAVAHDYHVRTFGTYSYQTMAHQWYWGRITAASGQFDEAVRLLADLAITWEKLYSTPNSAVGVTALVEQARVMVASGDASVRVECMLSDALRRIDVITSAQNLERPILDPTEMRLREGGLIFSQLAALRALGRIHVIRWSFGAAIMCFEQAVEVAKDGLIAQSSVRKLCETDLESARMLQLERVMGGLALDDPTSRLPPISSIVSLVPIET